MECVGELVSAELLPRVRGPGQYVGLETNARCGDVRSAEVTVALGFPDTYSIGISHLGSQVLYHMLNDIEGVACEVGSAEERFRCEASQFAVALGLAARAWRK